MRKTLSAIVVLLGLVGVGHASPITYVLPSFTQAAFQNSYTFTGTVTTDGALGSLSPSDIIAWSWTAVSPTLGPAFTISGSSTDAGSQVTFDVLIATSADLEIPPPTLPPWPDPANANLLTFVDNAGPTNENFGFYLSAGWSSPYAFQYESGYNAGPPNPNEDFRGASLKPLGETPISFVVGTAVPEPSSIALLTVGLIALAAVACRPRL